ncbi:MAG: polyphosphate kinase 2, partial [Hyphomicrobium sp.]
MSNKATKSAMDKRVEDELIDSLDEELELELDDDRVSRMLSGQDANTAIDTPDRQFYFREL